MEDPICSTDTKAWVKLLTKFKDSKVKFGSRKLYNNLESTKKLCEEVAIQNFPDKK
jgi:enolase